MRVLLIVLMTLVASCGSLIEMDQAVESPIGSLTASEWALEACEFELNADSSIWELREFIRNHHLDIKTAGRGRTKIRIYQDILEAMELECPCGDIPTNISMRELRQIIKIKGFDIKTAGRGRTKVKVREEVINACAGIENQSPFDFTQLMQTLEEHSAELELDYYGSESSYPLEVVRLSTQDAQLDSYEDFRNAVLEVGPETLGMEENFLDTVGRFEAAERTFYPYLNESAPNVAEAIIQILSGELTDTKLIIVGSEFTLPEPVHPVFIIGIAPDGSLIGLKAFVVWT